MKSLAMNNDINMLATYNAEVSRGILHTDEWIKKMEILQKQYNKIVFKGLGTPKD